jgi:hypothetical protein
MSNITKPIRRKIKWNKRHWNKLARRCQLQGGSMYKKLFAQYWEDGTYIDWHKKDNRLRVTETR